MIFSEPASPASTLTIADLLRGDLQLTSPPDIYFAIKSVLDDPDKSLQDAAAIIEDDASLTIRLLKIVNSAFYGFPRQIVSVNQAMSLIGSVELQNLVLSSVIMERFSDLPGGIMTMPEFWARNLRCALLARELDQRLGRQHGDVVFICGLLHNIGQLVFYRRIPLLAREVGLLMKSQALQQFDDEVRLEQHVIGFDHFETGAELCRLWKLPEVIVETIRLHNEQDDIGSYSLLSSIVRLAHGLCQLDLTCNELLVNRLGLPIPSIEEAVNKSHDEFEAIFKLFYPVKS